MGVTGAEARAGSALDRLATRPAWLACGGLVALAVGTRALGLSAPPALRYLPLAASAVLLGMPHGAVDYLVPAWLGDRSLPASLAIVGGCYLVLGGTYAALWVAAPTAAALLFIAVTGFHWGQGDVHALVAFLDATHLESRAVRFGTLVVRGGLPMVVPLVAFPGRYRAVVDSWVGLFGSDLTVPWLFTPETRIVAGAGLLALTVGSLLAGYRRAGASRGWRLDAAETSLLWVLFVLVPPLVAVGVYFTGWHSLRHLLRVAATDPAGGSVRSRLGRVALLAVPLTVLALVFVAAAGALLPTRLSSPSDLAALYLVGIAVLTVPHVANVTWMDRAEGIW